MIAEKKTISGKLLDVDFYPVFDNGKRLPSRAPKTKPSAEEQKKYNDLKSVRKHVRLACANFDESDYFMHITYEAVKAPQSEERARRDLTNYIQRVRRRRVSELKKTQKAIIEAKEACSKLPENEFLKNSLQKLKLKAKKLREPLRYIYVIEKVTYKSGRYAGRDNYHFHLLITGGIADSVMERMWPNGIRTNANNFQPEKYGPESAALYMSKNPSGKKRYSSSLNLKKPKEPKPKKLKKSRSDMKKLAEERADDREYWERRYKGYRFLRCYPRFNPYNGYWYVSVIMYRTNEEIAPKWDIEEWNLE